MAIQSGIFKFTGKLGNIVGYKLNGKYIARTIGKVDKAKMQTAPQYEVTRHNQSLFARASKAGQLFRQSMLHLTDGFTARDYASKVVSLMYQSLKADTAQQPDQKSIHNGLKTIDIQQAFRKLSLYNHNFQNHIPSTLLTPTSSTYQWHLNQTALWQKRGNSSLKLVQIGYLHIDFDASTATYEEAITISSSPDIRHKTQTINLQGTKSTHAPHSFVVVRVINHDEVDGTPTVQNLFILDVIDNANVINIVIPSIHPNASKAMNFIVLHSNTSKTMVTLAHRTRYKHKKLLKKVPKHHFKVEDN